MQKSNVHIVCHILVFAANNWYKNTPRTTLPCNHFFLSLSDFSSCGMSIMLNWLGKSRRGKRWKDRERRKIRELRKKWRDWGRQIELRSNGWWSKLAHYKSKNCWNPTQDDVFTTSVLIFFFPFFFMFFFIMRSLWHLRRNTIRTSPLALGIPLFNIRLKSGPIL